MQARLGGLFARHLGRAPTRDLARLEARVLERTLKHKPRDGSTHWSSRKLAAELKLPFMTVQRIWRKHNVQPHRTDRHMISNDPDFETNAAGRDRPVPEPAGARGRLLRGREDGESSTRSQGPNAAALARAAESHGFEYKRNGTLSLFAALNTATGEVLGMTAPRHTSAQFVAFLADVVASQPRARRST